MNDLRFHRKDGLFIAVCLLVLVTGVLVSLRYFKQAFPEAAVEFRYNRAQSGEIAAQFVDNLAWEISKGYRHASRFGYDDQAKTYLEKELGVAGAQPYLGKPVRLWYWQHRWFQPATKEEFKAFVTPGGEVVRVEHELPETAEGADLSEDSARAIAERFLVGVMGQDSTKLTFIESQRVGRPQRADWTFTYRAAGIEPVKGSEYRYSVGIIGDQFGSYREWLKVPEEWMASYRKLRSLNEAAGQVDAVAFLLTIVAMVAVFFIHMRRKNIRWRIALKFGLAALALIALNQVNEFSQTLYWYNTEDSWPGFLTSELLQGLLAAVAAGAIILLLTASAEPLYREQLPDKLALSRMFTARGMRTKSAFKNILLGVTLTSFFFAYQIVFYLGAAKFGAWSPSDVPYDNLLNTAMPWLAVLLVGFFPAVTEEFMSRMFSIPFLQKAFRNRMLWLALLIPAVIWGFGHAGYPNQPWWIRGAEVGIAGIIIGIVMLKWGILAALVWHYTVDAMYTAFLLFRSENLYFVFTAAVATGLLVIPLLVALIAYWRKGGFLPEVGVTNADDIVTGEPAPIVPPPIPKPPEIVEAPVTHYLPLPARGRMIGISILFAGAIAALIPVEKLGDFVEYRVTKDEAVRVFADSLRATGWADPDTLRIAAFVYDLDDQFTETHPLAYVLKHTPTVHGFNLLADTLWGAGRWRVRAWVPENRLRYSGSVHARTGRVESIFAWLPEELPGDSLTKDSARVLVEQQLIRQGEDTSQFVLKEYKDFARPQRLDHSFVYEAKDGDPRHVAEAKFRRDSRVDGNYISVSKRGWYKIPEAWERARNATTTLRAVRQGLTILAIIGSIVGAAIFFGARVKKGLVPWKQAFLIAIVPAIMALLTGVNSWYLSQADYFGRIEIAPGVFHIEQLTRILLDGMMTYLYFVIGLAFLGSLYPDKLPLLSRRERKAAALDTWIAAAAGVGFVLIIGSWTHWLEAWNTGWISFHGWNIPEWIAAPVPLLSMIDISLRELIFTAGIIGLYVYLWTGPMKRLQYRVLLVLALLFMLMPMQAVEPGEWLFEILHTLPAILLAWLLLTYVIAGRTAAFFASAFAASAYVIIARAIGSGYICGIRGGWVFTILAVILFALWWAPLLGKRRLPVD